MRAKIRILFLSFFCHEHTYFKAERNGGIGGTVQINQERMESKEERKERRFAYL